MSEASPAPAAVQDVGTKKRNLIIIAAALPVAALFALLGWSVVQRDGMPGGFGVNDTFGEASIENRPAPDFTAQTVHGETVRLSDMKGRVVMLDFWTSWCPPCRREAPALAEVYREYQGNNVEFVGVAIWDDPEDVKEYVESFGLTYPNLVDARGRIGMSYGVIGIPEKFFVGPDGNLVRKFVGPIDSETLRDALDELLGS